MIGVVDPVGRDLALRAVSRATGLAPKTITRGMDEIQGNKPSLPVNRQRTPGGGRKKLTDKDPQLQQDLDKLIEPYTRGDPMRPLRWTCKSTQKLADELSKGKRKISAKSVGRLLKEDRIQLAV